MKDAQRPDALSIAEEIDGLTLTYSRGDAYQSFLCLFAIAAFFALMGYVAWLARAGLFSSGWLLLPVSLGGGGLLLFVLCSGGLLRAPVRFTIDGSIRQAIWAWRYPGPFSVLPLKISGKRPRFQIELRYGQVSQRLAGSPEEGQVIAAAARLNEWSRSRIIGMPPDTATVRRTRDWTLFLGTCCVLWAALPLANLLFFGESYYLDGRANCGNWALASMEAFAVLALASLMWVLVRKANGPVRANAAVWLTEIAAALLVMAGTTTVVGRYAQIAQMYATPWDSFVSEQPLQLQIKQSGKGCRRFLILQEPTLGHAIKYCDGLGAKYWSDATAVRVYQSANRFGLHIDSVQKVS
jgi:hypothetical protein